MINPKVSPDHRERPRQKVLNAGYTTLVPIGLTPRTFLERLLGISACAGLEFHADSGGFVTTI